MNIIQTSALLNYTEAFKLEIAMKLILKCLSLALLGWPFVAGSTALKAETKFSLVKLLDHRDETTCSDSSDCEEGCFCISGICSRDCHDDDGNCVTDYEDRYVGECDDHYSMYETQVTCHVINSCSGDSHGTNIYVTRSCR